MEPTTTPSTFRPESSPTVSRPLAQKSLDFLFDGLKGQLGTKMADLWAGVNPKLIEAEWGNALAGMAPVELRRGLDACAGRKFAPTLGEFANLCRPTLDPEFAWHEAADCLRQRDRGEVGDWTHPSVFFACARMRNVDIRTADYKPHRVKWARILEQERNLGWRAVPAPVPRVPNDARVGPPNETERLRLEALRKAAHADLARRALEAHRELP